MTLSCKDVGVTSGCPLFVTPPAPHSAVWGLDLVSERTFGKSAMRVRLRTGRAAGRGAMWRVCRVCAVGVAVVGLGWLCQVLRSHVRQHCPELWRLAWISLL